MTTTIQAITDRTVERAEQALLAQLEGLGYRVAVRCRVCRGWLTDPRSVKAHVGPVCAARTGGVR